MMNGLVLLGISVAILVIAYLLYGRYLVRTWNIDPTRKTPAQEFEDGEEYVPTSPTVVFGHQFASIAGAGPINGPIIAAMFGWLPTIIWLLAGTVFFGGVHDFVALYASVKNQGKSIGHVIEIYIGKTGKRLFLLFVWLFSILIAAAFADIVAGTFVGFDAQGDPIEANASVASTSLLFIAVAALLGFLIRKKRLSDMASGIISVDMLVFCIVMGIFFPLYLSKTLWMYLIFGYIFVGSIVPIWSLGQARNYLNSFLLVAMMIAAFIGVIFTAPEISIPAFTGFEVNGNYLFPSLFVTIACGAISGFHSLVATGTASKEISNERYMLPISYGAMLLETLLAVLALISVGSLAVGGKLPSGTPPQIFATAVSGFLHKIGLSERISFTLISLAISSFVFTTLDTVARLGRLTFQEFFAGSEHTKPSRLIWLLTRKPVASACTLIFAYLLAILGYQNIWPLFGAANQLLAALTLIACAVFLKKTRRRGFMLFAPTCIMLGVTFTSLIFTIRDKGAKYFNGTLSLAADGVQLLFGVLLLVLGVIVVVACVVKLGKKTQDLDVVTIKGV
ncbi:MAG: carbon starvation protein A [Treponema sp.]|jgi:carbon starvation protein|nr:carbon starvation protein A [Treponema sp.]